VQRWPNLKNLPVNAIPAEVIFSFGADREFSVGELVNVEREIQKRELLTVRMRRQFGLLPQLQEDLMPERGRQDIAERMEKVIAGYRSSPGESVVDRCREAIVAVLSFHLGVVGKDLKDLVTMYEGANREKRDATSDLAHVIGRLHARGKFSEQSGKGLPPISEREAELCVVARGVVLVNLEMARWQ
jgi:hypothetical protein